MSNYVWFGPFHAYQRNYAKRTRLKLPFLLIRIGGKRCFPCWFTLLHISYV